MVARLREQWLEENEAAFVDGACHLTRFGKKSTPRNTFKTANELLEAGGRIKPTLAIDLVNPEEADGEDATEDRLHVLASLFYPRVMGEHFLDHETFDTETRAAAVMAFAIFHPGIDPTQVRLHPRDRYPFYESP